MGNYGVAEIISAKVVGLPLENTCECRNKLKLFLSINLVRLRVPGELRNIAGGRKKFLYFQHNPYQGAKNDSNSAKNVIF